jgi:peptidyl-prolyl cis-trans isomerase A (cyclophilin A)
MWSAFSGSLRLSRMPRPTRPAPVSVGSESVAVVAVVFRGHAMNARWLLCPLLVAVAAVLHASPARAGTIVRFDTNLADFDVELFDDAMPITVANFLSYVNAGTYTSTLIHRSTTYNPADIQIIQGGGYLLSGNQILSVPTNAPIVLESGTATNVRGTIAMARGAATDSATTQFFFNVQSNPALNGNYAVFGRVVGAEGLAALDTIGLVPVYDLSQQFGSAFGEVPLTVATLEPSSLVLVNSVTAVPEPSTLLLAAVGVGAAGRRGRLTAAGRRTA